MTARSRQTFRQLITLPDLGIPLAEAALLMACEEYPHLSLEPYLNQLDTMAERVCARIGPGEAPMDKIEKINDVLFREYGFRGNAANYFDPRNSFLNDVIDRRLGIPITLSTIYLEVAGRLKLPIEGVGMPGHFVVKYRSGNHEILLDPFNGGSVLTRNQCTRFLAHFAVRPGRNTELALRRVTNRQILARMLDNLRMIYLKAETFDKALARVEMMVLLEPDIPTLRRDRGLLRLHVRQFPGAARDLRRYLENLPAAADREEIEKYLKEIERIRATLN